MFLVFLASFLLYLLSSYPTIAVGDCGELITAAYTLGIPHPPGYPLWTIIGKIFTIIIPFGNIAYRLNLMSAFFGAATCSILFLLIKKISSNWIYSFLIALCMAFSNTFWSQSIQVKGGIYTLNTFFIVLIIYLIFFPLGKTTDIAIDNSIQSLDNTTGKQSILSKLTPRNLLIICFIYGISLTNHYIMLLISPAFLIYLILDNAKIAKAKHILLFFIFIFLGLLLYSYLPIRSSLNPPIDWGNPENPINFIAHLGRFQYKGLELEKKVGILTKIYFLKNIFPQYIQNYGVVLSLLSIIGLVYGFFKNFKFTILTFLIFIINTVVLIFLLNFKYTPQDIDAFKPYFLPAWIMVSLWISNLTYVSTKNVYKISLIILISVLLAANIKKNYQLNSNRYNFIAYDYPTNILKTITKNTTLYLKEEVDETIFTLSYLQNVIKKRRDIKIFDSYNNIFIQNGTVSKPPEYYSTINGEKIKVPVVLYGLLWAVNKKSEYNPWLFYSERLPVKLINYREQEVIARYSYFYGLSLIKTGQKKEGIYELKKSLESGKHLIWLNNNVGDILRQNNHFNEAEITLDRTLQLDNSYSPAYYNLGLLYLQKQNEEKAIENFQKAFEYDNNDKDSLFQLSKIYQNLGYKYYIADNINEAILKYKKASEYTPDNADIYYNIGVIYAQTNNKKEAKYFLNKYLEMNRGGKNANIAKKWLEIN